MAKIFERAGMRKPNMSAFDLSREQKLSCRFGELIPTYIEEVVPGDHFKVNSEILIRMAPMLAPVMHRVDVYMHYYFVPNRIIWNQWENFITGGREGTTTPTFPTYGYGSTAIATSRLTDYLGLPLRDAAGGTPNDDIQFSALPFRAYQRIYLDYYRDPNLVPEFDLNTASNNVLSTLRVRSFEKDYFTSALPWLQRGPAIGVPVEFDYMAKSEYYDQYDGNASPGPATLVNDGGKTVMSDPIDPVALRVENLDDNMRVNINELRKSSAIQRWLEKMAVGGARYTEQILAMFGVRSQDSRLQRAEYLGGGKQPLVISEVLNTTGTAEAPQGDMAGHGMSIGKTNSFDYKVPEHGYIMGIMSVIPRTNYQQGIPRHFLRRDKLDFYWPEFANLGEQEIENQEIYMRLDESLEINKATFGYQQRYAEYKYGVSTVHGEFRNSLNFWHMGRIFATRPNLNAQFMEARPTNSEMTRIFAVPSGDTLWCQLFHNVKARRPMPYFADPRLS